MKAASRACSSGAMTCETLLVSPEIMCQNLYKLLGQSAGRTLRCPAIAPRHGKQNIGVGIQDHDIALSVVPHSRAFGTEHNAVIVLVTQLVNKMKVHSSLRSHFTLMNFGMTEESPSTKTTTGFSTTGCSAPTTAVEQNNESRIATISHI